MRRKLVIGLLIIVILGFAFYNFAYLKLKQAKEDKVIAFSQKINQFQEKKEQVLNFKKVKLKYQKLLQELKAKNSKNFLQQNEINRFIIYLNGFEVIENVDFNPNPTSNLIVNFQIRGELEKIYDFLAKINYIYDTKKMEINKADDKVAMKLVLVFPIGGSD